MCKLGFLAPVTKVELELSSRRLTLAPTVGEPREPRQLPGDQAGVSYTAWEAGVELQEKVSILLSNLSGGRCG